MNDNKNRINNRLSKLRKLMVQKGMDAVLVTKRENYMYLSGFTGTSAYLVITQDSAVLMTDFRYIEQAAKQAPMYEVVKYQGSFVQALGELLKSRGIGRLGFEDNYLTYERYAEFEQKLGMQELIPLKGIIENLRMIKDADEIEIIKKAVKISDDAFTHILSFIKPGTSETEIAAELEYFMKKQGASKEAFDTIVASGERSSLPHGVASEKRLEAGDAITLDFGAIYMGYCSDMTRTVFLGKPCKELEKIYEIVLEAQSAALEGAHKGMSGKAVDLIARDIITKAGFGDYFGHGLGHGVGIEIHEEPRFSPSGNTVIEDGMIITVEPGIYVPGLGGVRIEDMIVINGDNPIDITGATKKMLVL